jgi:RNA-directed DNA polymerase
MGKSLLRQVRTIDTLGRAWRVIEQNARTSLSLETKQEVRKFAERSAVALTKIQRRLCNDAFEFEAAKGIPIPKKTGTAIRPIVVAPIESRIVQRAILEVLLKVPGLQLFLQSPFSFGGIQKREGSTLAAVPAAVQATLDGIGCGAKYVVRSDISSFFARIPKPAVRKIVAQSVLDAPFMELFDKAISVELSNMAALKAHETEFPIHEIGVAQGNSLSPLLGNIYLADFDSQLNDGGIRCIRYIDDFLLLAPTRAAAEKSLSRAVSILSDLGLEISAEKTQVGAVSDGFQFLGVEFQNGIIRPSRKSRQRLLGKVSQSLDRGMRAIDTIEKGRAIERSETAIRVLSEVSGVVTGWGNQYRFCNELNLMAQLDDSISKKIDSYLNRYESSRRRTGSRDIRYLLGVPLLADVASHAMKWPTTIAA